MTQKEIESQIISRIQYASVPLTAQVLANWILENFEPKKEKTLADLMPGDLVRWSGDGELHPITRIYTDAIWVRLVKEWAFTRSHGNSTAGHMGSIRVPTQEEIDAHHAKEASLKKSIITKIDAATPELLEQINALFSGRAF
jgi:hypothetical protein